MCYISILFLSILHSIIQSSSFSLAHPPLTRFPAPPLVLGCGVGGPAAMAREELGGFKGDLRVPRMESGAVLSTEELLRKSYLVQDFISETGTLLDFAANRARSDYANKKAVKDKEKPDHHWVLLVHTRSSAHVASYAWPSQPTPPHCAHSPTGPSGRAEQSGASSAGTGEPSMAAPYEKASLRAMVDGDVSDCVVVM